MCFFFYLYYSAVCAVHHIVFQIVWIFYKGSNLPFRFQPVLARSAIRPSLLAQFYFVIFRYVYVFQSGVNTLFQPLVEVSFILTWCIALSKFFGIGNVTTSRQTFCILPCRTLALSSFVHGWCVTTYLHQLFLTLLTHGLLRFIYRNRQLVFCLG